MAYNGGTTLIAPRLLSEQHDWLKANTTNVNKAINAAVHEYVRRLQAKKVPEEQMIHINVKTYTRGLYYYRYSWQNRRKVSVRVERQCLDYLRMNCYMINRVLDFAIDDYIKKEMEIK